MIGIIGAMKIETDGVISLLSDRKTEIFGGIEFVSGKVFGKEVTVATCGVGKVFAAMCTQAMAISCKPDCIINTGIAGSLSNALHIGDIVLAESCVQHDMDTSALGDEPGLISGINKIFFHSDTVLNALLEKCLCETGAVFKKGIIASGDQFISSDEGKEKIKKNFGAMACEMEAASMAQVCYVNKVPFSAIRVISDEADGNSHMDFPTFAKMSADSAITLVREFIRRY